MEKTSLKNCKLIDLRLLESSSKYLNPDLEVKKLALTMRHELNFEVLPEKNGEKGFCLNLNTKLSALANDGDEYFTLNTVFRGNYDIIGSKRLAPEKFKEISDLLGHQLYPVVRTFITNLLAAMGAQLQIPWQLPEPQDTLPAKLSTKSQKKE